jgi:GGDEF domain-containing protein
VLCHLGDGRFVLLYPATPFTEAMALADRMRGDVERELLYIDDMAVGVTCTIGVADNQSPRSGALLDAAEEAFGRARASGGNMIRGGAGDISAAA